MKKLYTLIMACATALMATAAMPQMAQKYVGHQSAGKYARVEHALQSNSKGMVKAIGAEEVITAPEGEKSTYMLQSLNFEVDFMGGLVLMNEQTQAEIVWGEDGTVYLKDIMLGIEQSNVYVEGELVASDREGVANTIVVELPQVCSAVELEDGEMIYALASLMELTLDDDDYVVSSNVDPDDNVVYYDVYEDGTIKLRLNDGDPTDPSVLPPYLIGLIDEYEPGEDTWYGYGIAYAEYSEFPYVTNTIPEDVELETWAIMSNSGNKIVQVGFDDNTFYMTGFSELVPESVVVGTVKGNKVEMEFPQYLGTFEGYLMFFQGVEWDSDVFIECEPLENLALNYDAEARRISVDNPLIDLGVCVGGEFDSLYEYFEDPVIAWLDQNLVNAAPKSPKVDYYDPFAYREWYDSYEGYIDWSIPAINVNDQPLDPSRMYYNLYVDGELWTLTVEEFPGFEEDVTDIPYDFGDDFDLQVLDESHYITFKFEGSETFGCQSYYLGSDGVTYPSGISTYDVETGELTGNVSAVAQKSIKSVELYNLQGQRVNAPRGFTLHKITYTDGTVQTIKTLSK